MCVAMFCSRGERGGGVECWGFLRNSSQASGKGTCGREHGASDLGGWGGRGGERLGAEVVVLLDR